MWAAVSASVIGTSHEATCTPCQDACRVVRLKVGDEEVLLAAVADGAGSASYSQIGSSEAVQHVLKLVTQAELDLATINQEQIRGWYQEVLEHLKTVAERESVSIGELACTLLLAIVWKNGAVFGQVGDGAWVMEKGGELVAGTWPETGEYANVTVFLTTKDALDLSEAGAMTHLQFKRLEGPVNSVAGFTDGIQTLALDFSQRMPFGRFFNKMFTSLRACSDETELIAPLQQMLASDVITSRTDDDKTLVLAVWREPEPKAEAKPDGTAE